MCKMVPYDSGLVTNTQYLTPELAYFMGGIYAANEHIQNENEEIIWAFPVRYNANMSTVEQITEHYDYVRAMSKQVGGYTAPQESLTGAMLGFFKQRHHGFVTVFKSLWLADLHDGLEGLEHALDNSSDLVKRAFILGIIDGRGTPDVSIEKRIIRYISTDCQDEEVGEFFYRFLQNCGYECNYNPPREREDGSTPRKPQFRIKRKSVEKYMREIGYISPAKFVKMENVYDAIYGSHRTVACNNLFSGVKTLLR